MMAEEKVRLNYLVVAKCAAHMRQGFVDCIRQEQVSRQFATALKSVLCDTPVSVTVVADMDSLNIELECAASKRSMLHHEGAFPSRKIVEFHKCAWDTSKLLLSVAPHVKELKVKGKFSIGPEASKQLWDAISKCSRLRQLSIAGGSGAWHLSDSADTISSTFQDNSYLWWLGLKAEMKLLSSPLLLPIVSKLHRLSIEATFDRSADPIAEDDELMSDIRFILQSLPHNATFCMKLLLTESEDEVGEQMLNCVKTFLELSNTAKKPIKLHFEHKYYPLRYPDVDTMAGLIEEREWCIDDNEDAELYEIERVGRTCVVSGSNAKVTISIVT